MTTYVSPLDPRTVEPVAFAARPAALDGRRIVLLDISKARGAEFLDRLAELFHADGATTHRLVKPAFSRNAPGELLGQVKIHGDLAVEGLGD